MQVNSIPDKKMPPTVAVIWSNPLILMAKLVS
jgi:hypothetical protein